MEQYEIIYENIVKKIMKQKLILKRRNNIYLIEYEKKCIMGEDSYRDNLRHFSA